MSSHEVEKTRIETVMRSTNPWVSDLQVQAVAKEVESIVRERMAEAWSVGAHAAIELHNTGTRMTLRARIPFPADENPYVRSPSEGA